MQFALPDLCLTTVMPLNTVGGSERAVPTDKAWEELLLQNLDEVAAVQVPIPLVPSLQFNPELVLFAPNPETVPVVPIHFVLADQLHISDIPAEPTARVPEAETLLVGRQPDATVFALVAELLLEGAQAHGDKAMGSNAFKLTLARRAIVRALEMARDGELTNTGEMALHAQEQS